MLGLQLPITYTQLPLTYCKHSLNRTQPIKIDKIKALYSHKVIGNKQKSKFKG